MTFLDDLDTPEEVDHKLITRKNLHSYEKHNRIVKNKLIPSRFAYKCKFSSVDKFKNSTTYRFEIDNVSAIITYITDNSRVIVMHFNGYRLVYSI